MNLIVTDVGQFTLPLDPSDTSHNIITFILSVLLPRVFVYIKSDAFQHRSVGVVGWVTIKALGYNEFLMALFGHPYSVWVASVPLEVFAPL